jgi:hypothetical protein
MARRTRGFVTLEFQIADFRVQIAFEMGNLKSKSEINQSEINLKSAI